MRTHVLYTAYAWSMPHRRRVTMLQGKFVSTGLLGLHQFSGLHTQHQHMGTATRAMHASADKSTAAHFARMHGFHHECGYCFLRTTQCKASGHGSPA